MSKEIIDNKIMYSFYNACEEFLKECSSSIEYTPKSPPGKTTSPPGETTPTPGKTTSPPGETTPTPGGVAPDTTTDLKTVKSIKLSPISSSIDKNKPIVGDVKKYEKLTAVVGGGFEKKFLFDQNADMETDSFIEELLRKIAAKQSDGTLALVESGESFKLADPISDSFTYKDSSKVITANYSADIIIEKQQTNTKTTLRITLSRLDNPQIKGTVSLYMNKIVDNFSVTWE